MKKNVIEAAIWAFAKNELPQPVLSAAKFLKTDDKVNPCKYQDKVLEKVIRHYLGNIKAPRPFDQGEYTRIVNTNIELAYDVSDGMFSHEFRSKMKKVIVYKGLECLKKLDRIIDGILIALLQKVAAEVIGLSFTKDQDVFAKNVMNKYLDISHLRGEEAVEIILLMRSQNGLREAERVIPIFIKRGNLEALRLIGKKYNHLNDYIKTKAEDIVLACLKNGDIENAAEAVLLMADPEEKKNYSHLLSINDDDDVPEK